MNFLNYIDRSFFPKKISIGTDCSGIEAPIQALELLDIEVDHLFSCDNDRHAIESIKANYNPKHIYNDILNRDHSKLPYVDLYVAGFPCQTFSTLGNREGFNNLLKGTIFFECLETIRCIRPKIFILENVKGLIQHNKGATFKTIMDSLRDLSGYEIYHDLYNTRNYGIPQNRERVYIIGIDKTYIRHRYKIPRHIDTGLKLSDMLYMDLQSTYGLTDHKRDVLNDLVKNRGIDEKDLWCMNLNVSSWVRTHPMKDISPCLLRASVHYVSGINRNLYPRECLRLQGFPDSFHQVVSDRQLYHQAGNSMSVNVLCFIYMEIFRALN